MSHTTQLEHETLSTQFVGNVHPLSTEETAVVQFLGIKYASVPARFRQSKLFTSYPPVTDATRHGPICPQMILIKSVEEELFGLADDVHIPEQSLEQNEFDCLNLNITSPAGVTRASRLPVMLWIHGGGDRGSGSSWLYDGFPLVSKSISEGKPVILVSINFRIGLFGFAANQVIRADNESTGDKGIGNYGLHDQRRALEWVHRFISDFGGDPDNVTLFGSNTGAADILSHLLSAANETHPLFHRAILQSPLFDLNPPDLYTVSWQFGKIVCELGARTIEEMRAVSADRLVQAGEGMGWRVIDDGVFLRRGWKESVIPSGDSTRPTSVQLPANLQPIIIGDTSYESFPWAPILSRWSPTSLSKRIRAVTQSLYQTTALLNAYDIAPTTSAEDTFERLTELVGDLRVGWMVDCIVEGARRERGGKGVWRYVFDQEGPGRQMAHCGADLVYLFDTAPLGDLRTGSEPSAQSSEFGGGEDCFDYGNEGFGEGERFDVDSEDELEVGLETTMESHLRSCSPLDPRFARDEDSDGFEEDYDDYFDNSDFDETTTTQTSPNTASTSLKHYDYDDSWALARVSPYAYSRVCCTIQSRWIAFANGEAPWADGEDATSGLGEKVFVFGPEGEVGERSGYILEGRRRRGIWRDSLGGGGLAVDVAMKAGVELCRGPRDR